MSISTRIPQAAADSATAIRFSRQSAPSRLSPRPVSLTEMSASSARSAIDSSASPVLAHKSQGLLAGLDRFAEHVDRRRLAGRVQLRDHVTRVGERLARDVALRHPPDDRPRDGREDTDERAVEHAALALAHEALAGGADERDRLGEEHAHGVAQRERLLV